MTARGNRVVLFIGLVLVFLGGIAYLHEENKGPDNIPVQVELDQAELETDILEILGKWEGELTDGEYFTLVDEDGNELDRTGHEVFIGDEMILEDNNRYKVTEVDDKKLIAICDLVGKEEIAWEEEENQLPVLDVAQGKSVIGVYMTHNDESYVPSDGQESIKGNGGIIQVGEKLAEELKKNGVDAEINLNKHDPHDANAYHRSRKTAVQLLKANPSVIVDVHRDGIPDPGFYATKIDGESATKIRLVVGRQNPHVSSNLEFAKQIKGYFDKNTPGLIKGIFMGKGNYNQDLGPKAILVEVGTYTNTKGAALNGITAFADGLPAIVGAGVAKGVPGTPAAKGPSPGVGRSLIWLLLFVVVGGGAFLLISTGSIKDSVKRITNMGKEFSNNAGTVKVEEKGKNKQRE